MTGLARDRSQTTHEGAADTEDVKMHWRDNPDWSEILMCVAGSLRSQFAFNPDPALGP
jgi:hypothetical protein